MDFLFWLFEKRFKYTVTARKDAIEMRSIPAAVADAVQDTWTSAFLLISNDLGDASEEVYESFIDLRRARNNTLDLIQDLIEIEIPRNP